MHILVTKPDITVILFEFTLKMKVKDGKKSKDITMKTVNTIVILTLIFLVLYFSFFCVQKFQKKNTSFSISQKVGKKLFYIAAQAWPPRSLHPWFPKVNAQGKFLHRGSGEDLGSSEMSLTKR